MKENGILITFEGIDGSGKTSAAKDLYEDLKEEHPVILTREPGATELGSILRSLVQNRTCTIHPKAEYLLFAADRAEHFQQVVLPALTQGKIVISDRMGDSSLAYQGYGRGVDPSMIKLINTWAMGNREPDATVYLEIDYGTARERLQERNELATSFEEEQHEFFDRVKEGFEQAFVQRESLIRIDGSQPKDLVRQQVKDNVISFLTMFYYEEEASSSESVDRL